MWATQRCLWHPWCDNGSAITWRWMGSKGPKNTYMILFVFQIFGVCFIYIHKLAADSRQYVLIKRITWYKIAVLGRAPKGEINMDCYRWSMIEVRGWWYYENIAKSTKSYRICKWALRGLKQTHESANVDQTQWKGITTSQTMTCINIGWTT